MAFSAKITTRIQSEIKRYQGVLGALQKKDVSEADTVTAAKSDEVLECFGHLSRETFSKSTMADLLHHKQVTNKFTVAAIMLSDDLIESLRREIRRLGSGVKVEPAYLRSILTQEIIKRELIDSEEAKAAAHNVRRLQRSVS